MTYQELHLFLKRKKFLENLLDAKIYMKFGFIFFEISKVKSTDNCPTIYR